MSANDRLFSSALTELFTAGGRNSDGVFLNPHERRTQVCDYCDGGYMHEGDGRCVYEDLPHPEYVFGVRSKRDDYAVFTWAPDIRTLTREGIVEPMKQYESEPTVSTVLKDITEMCIKYGRQYSDEDPFPEDAVIVFPSIKPTTRHNN